MSKKQESGFSYFNETEPFEWSLIGFLEWKSKTSLILDRTKEHNAFKSFLQNIISKNNTNAQRARELLVNWKDIKCSLKVEKFWDDHKKVQDLRQDIQHVKIHNELKSFQTESEDLNYALDRSNNLNFTTIESKGKTMSEKIQQLSATKYQKGVSTVVDAEIDKCTEKAINSEVSSSKRPYGNDEAVASKKMTESQQSATPHLTLPMTEVAESSSSNSDLGDLEGSKNKDARSQYLRDDSSSHESMPCPTRSVTHTLLLKENPGAIDDCKLIINNVCIRSAMEKWRESSKYVEEIHKQELMRYNIIDTTASSATEVRKLFKEHWDDIISAVEKLLTSSPNATQLASAFASTSASSDQNTVQDGQAEEVKQYTKYVSKNVNSAKKLREAIKTERARLRINGNIKWKRRALRLMKIFRDQFPNDVNYFKEDQTEYGYIIRFISDVYTILFKDKTFLKQTWGETTLRSSATLLN